MALIKLIEIIKYTRKMLTKDLRFKIGCDREGARRLRGFSTGVDTPYLAVVAVKNFCNLYRDHPVIRLRIVILFGD